MGPQPWELRKPPMSMPSTRRTICFNGAAALGAAETQTLARHEHLAFLLQWGRSLGSCGNVMLHVGLVLAPELQWGRSLGSCGNLIYYGGIMLDYKLQWGRSLGSC